MQQSLNVMNVNMWFKKTKDKHIKTKHAEHECNSCKLKSKTALEALKHTAQDHSSNIQEDKRESESTEKSVTKTETQVEMEEEDTAEQMDIDTFKCEKCKEILFKKHALMEYTEGGQNMCSLCTMARTNGLVQPLDCIAPVL